MGTKRETNYHADIVRHDPAKDGDDNLWVNLKQWEYIYPKTATGATQWTKGERNLTEVLNVRLDDLPDILQEATTFLANIVADFGDGKTWAKATGEPEPLKCETLADDPDDYPRTTCGCGYDIVYVEGGWQHDAAPYFWGDDHDATPDDPDAIAAAEAWDEAHSDDKPA